MMTRHRRDGGSIAVTMAALAPVLMALIVHPAMLTVIAVLVADTGMTIFRWLWLLRRDRLRQRMAEALVYASSGQPGRIGLDPSGGIEVHHYGPADPGHSSPPANADQASAARE